MANITYPSFERYGCEENEKGMLHFARCRYNSVAGIDVNGDAARVGYMLGSSRRYTTDTFERNFLITYCWELDSE
jgi:hypothetical protein